MHWQCKNIFWRSSINIFRLSYYISNKYTLLNTKPINIRTMQACKQNVYYTVYCITSYILYENIFSLKLSLKHLYFIIARTSYSTKKQKYIFFSIKFRDKHRKFITARVSL